MSRITAGLASIFLDLDYAKFNTGSERAAATMEKLAERMEGVSRLARNMLLGLGGATAFILKSSIDQQDADEKLTAVLHATGDAAGYTISQLKDYAKQLENVTTYSDQSIERTMAVIASFKNIKGDNFKRTTEAVLDMSTVLGRSASIAALQLGKALNDPIKGMITLRRAGVQFTDAQRAQIAALVQSNDLFGAQQVILKQVESRFKGAAEAMAQTFGGQLLQLKNKAIDLGETLGFALMPHLTNLVSTLQMYIPIMDSWIRGHGELVVHTTELTAAMLGLLYVVPKVVAGVGTLISAYSNLSKATALFTGTNVTAGLSLAYSVGGWKALGRVLLSVSAGIASTVAAIALIAGSIVLLGAMVYQVTIKHKSWSQAAYDTARSLGVLRGATLDLGDALSEVGNMSNKLKDLEGDIANAKNIYEKKRIMNDYLTTIDEAIELQKRLVDAEKRSGKDTGGTQRLNTLEKKKDDMMKAMADLDKAPIKPGPAPEEDDDDNDPTPKELRKQKQQEDAAKRHAEEISKLKGKFSADLEQDDDKRKGNEFEAELKDRVQQFRDASDRVMEDEKLAGKTQEQINQDRMRNEALVLQYIAASRQQFYAKQQKARDDDAYKTQQETDRANEERAQQLKEFEKKVSLIGKTEAEKRAIEENDELQDLLAQAQHLNLSKDDQQKIKDNFKKQKELDDAKDNAKDKAPAGRSASLGGLEDTYRSILQAGAGTGGTQTQIAKSSERAAKATEKTATEATKQTELLRSIKDKRNTNQPAIVGA